MKKEIRFNIFVFDFWGTLFLSLMHWTRTTIMLWRHMTTRTLMHWARRRWCHVRIVTTTHSHWTLPSWLDPSTLWRLLLLLVAPTWCVVLLRIARVWILTGLLGNWNSRVGHCVVSASIVVHLYAEVGVAWICNVELTKSTVINTMSFQCFLRHHSRLNIWMKPTSQCHLRICSYRDQWQLKESILNNLLPGYWINACSPPFLSNIAIFWTAPKAAKTYA